MKRKLSSILAVCGVLVAIGLSFAKTGMDDQKNMTTGKHEQALFAGGCFWCMTKPFQVLDGVISVKSGYAGGTSENPTYETHGRDGHIEVVHILYDPQKISYGRLLDTFWRQIDPTDAGGQFVDRGHSYISGIFVYNDEQRRQAEESKKILASSGVFKKPIVTQVLDAPKFWEAEEYHQDYYKKNPLRYHFYRSQSGRDNFLQKAWKGVNLDLSAGAQAQVELTTKLTALQYQVTQEEGTEPPFKNAYWDNKKPGLYVDIVSGEALFSSTDKYDSGTGWPSFVRPVDNANIVQREDKNSSRSEPRSAAGRETPTWDMSLMTDLPRQVCVIASILLPYGSFRLISLLSQAWVCTGACSTKNSRSGDSRLRGLGNNGT